MNDVLISIVVPVYNVEAFLPACLDRIINQTYPNLEILLVDDGATDSSAMICEQYKEKDNRIVVLHKPNGGLSDARNHAIDVAKGELITFIDSDDLVDTTYCEELLKTMQKHDVDISICNTVLFCEDLPESGTAASSFVYEGTDAAKAFFQGRFGPTAWGKLYKRELFKDIRYPKGKINEDLFVILELLLLCNKIASGANTNYYYRQRRGSIQNSSSVKTADYIEAHAHNYSLIQEKVPNLSHLAESAWMYSYLNASNILIKNNAKDNRLLEYKQFMRKNLRTMLRSQSESFTRKGLVLLLLACEPLYVAIYKRHHKKFIQTLT